jgi:glycosyltransferase involved in cell wall biosynthesis
MMKEKPGVSVVVSTYNRPRALSLALLGLSRQIYPPAQIVIADDGSDEQTKQTIDRWVSQGLPVEHVWHEDLGYRKTIIMNKAFSRVTSELTIFMDGDCVPSPEFVADHLKLHEPNMISAGPRILASPDLTNQLEATADNTWFEGGWVRWIKDRLSGSINRLLPLIRLSDGTWRHAKGLKWELVRGCNFSVATSAIWAVDGFEESLFGWGPDDSDIAVRLLNAGLRIKSARFSCPVLHLWHKEESRVGLERNRAYLQSAIEQCRVKAITGLSSHGLTPPNLLKDESVESAYD